MRVKGEYVTYKENGVCLIIDETPDFYILEPVYHKNMTMYVPKASESLVNSMCDVIKSEDIDSLIQAAKESPCKWVDNSKKRTESFYQIIKGGNKADILWIVGALSSHKIKVENERKNFYSSDKRILDTASKMVADEIAFALNMDPKEVLEMLLSKLGVKA